MKKSVICGLAVLSLVVSQAANAITITGSVGGAPSGTSRINFDNLALGSAGGTATGPNGSVDVSFNPDGQTVVGAVLGQYAAPWLSGGNGSGFAAGGADQADGEDLTKYLTTGLGEAILDFGNVSLNYFGLLWGSIDHYNTLKFYNGNSLVDTVTGTDVFAGANGDREVNGTMYVNIDTSAAFNRVVASSSQYAFEFDNVAYSAVPDSGMTIALLGMGLLGLGCLRGKLA
jgi:hypothetical protein